MKIRTVAACTALAAGLAFSSAASAQYSFVTNQAGAFVDISSTGTLLGGGDDSSYTFALPANCSNPAFPAGTLHVCTNGHVGYGGVDTQYSNVALPASFAYTGAVACVYWDDLITTATHGGNMYAQVIGDTLIVQWNNIDHYSSSPNAMTFELKVFGNGSGPGGAMAQYIYQSTDSGDANANGASATIGYQVAPGNAIQFAYNTAGSVQAGTVLTLLNNIPTGACCAGDGTCSVTTQALCTAAAGVYRGDSAPCATANCPQPATGACCTDNGCSIRTQAQCAAAGGTYGGDNSTCASINCPVNLVTNGNFETGDLTGWTQFGDTSFTGVAANAAHAGNWGFRSGPTLATGGGIQQTITAAAGTQVDVSFWLRQESTGTPNSFSFALDGQTLLSLTDDTTHATYTQHTYHITLQNANPLLQITCYNSPSWWHVDDVKVTPPAGPASCYANCDGSSVAPILNVNDFICFQTKFAQNDTYANCDGSTVPPILNVNDFICFQTKFAQGCP